MPTGDLAITPFNHQHPYAPDLRMQRDTINERDVIIPAIRWEGMTVYVLENETTYQLQGGLTNEFWVILGTGVTGGGTGETTDMAAEDFYHGMLVLDEPDEYVIYAKGPKDIIYPDGGNQILYPGFMGNLVITMPSVIDGVGYADIGNEFSITNHSTGVLTITHAYASAPAQTAFDLPGDVDLEIAVGETVFFKGNGTAWEVGPNTSIVTFSDTLNSVNATISTGPDNLDVISNVFDKETGEEVTFKEVSGTPTPDGVIYIQIGVKYYKRNIHIGINPKKFGAKGDGVTNDSLAIQKALDSELKITCNEDDLFFMSDSVSTLDKKININRLRVKLDHTSGDIIGGVAFSFQTSVVLTGDVDNTATITESSTSLPVVDSTGIEVGDLIKIYCDPQTSGTIATGRTYVITAAGGDFASVGAADNNVGTSFVASGSSPTWTGGELLVLWDYDPRPGVTNVRPGETNKVIGIAGNVLTVDTPLMDQYHTSFNLKFDIRRPKQCTINELLITADEPGDFGGVSIGGYSPVIQNSELDKVSGRVGISLGICYMANISNITIKDGYYTGTATGYGIQDNGSTGTNITGGSSFINNRRGVDFSGSTPSKLANVNSCTFISNSGDTGSCAGTHGGADLMTFENNIFSGGILGLQIRSPRTYVRSNTFKHNSIANIIITTGDHLYVTGNNSVSNNDPSAINQPSFIQVVSTTVFTKERPLVLKDNSAINMRRSFMRLSAGQTLNGLIMRNNNVTIYSNSSGVEVGFIWADAGDEAVISGAIISENTIKSFQGIYSDMVNVNVHENGGVGDFLRVIKDSDLEVWGGAGTLANISVDIKQSCTIDNWALVEGKVAFDVVGTTARVRLTKLQKSNYDLTKVIYSINGNPLSITTGGELYMGYEIGDSSSTLFPVGSHVVDLRLKYKIRDGFGY